MHSGQCTEQPMLYCNICNITLDNIKAIWILPADVVRPRATAAMYVAIVTHSTWLAITCSKSAIILSCGYLYKGEKC